MTPERTKEEEKWAGRTKSVKDGFGTYNLKAKQPGGLDIREAAMKYKRMDRTYVVRIDLNEEIVESLGRLCEQEGIRLARVSAIGAANGGEIGVYDLASRTYHREELEEFMEITSLSGSVTTMEGKPYIHLHATLADANHAVHGGHVIRLRVGATCEMFVDVLEGSVDRKRDEALGINLWEF